MTRQPANWELYVLEYARSKDQPWVDLISGMYKDGVMDLKDRVLRFSDTRRLEELGAFDPLYLHQDPKL